MLTISLPNLRDILISRYSLLRLTSATESSAATRPTPLDDRHTPLIHALLTQSLQDSLSLLSGLRPWIQWSDDRLTITISLTQTEILRVFRHLRYQITERAITHALAEILTLSPHPAAPPLAAQLHLRADDHRDRIASILALAQPH